jgi:hypothetical protein
MCQIMVTAVKAASPGVDAICVSTTLHSQSIVTSRSPGGRPQSAFVTERVHLVFSFPYWEFGLKVD